jgi:hypothetical protein
MLTRRCFATRPIMMEDRTYITRADLMDRAIILALSR